MFRKELLTALVLLLGLVTAVSPVAGQDCGRECDVCGDNKWEGTSFSTSGPYHMTCGVRDEGGCSTCDGPALRTGFVDAATIAKLMDSVSENTELATLARTYRDRLLMNSERDILVISGTACDNRALTAAVFLPPGKSRVLERVGLRPLDDFLTSESEDVSVRVASEG